MHPTSDMAEDVYLSLIPLLTQTREGKRLQVLIL